MCEELKDELKLHKHRFSLHEVDISLPENKRWRNLYKFEIPVLFLEGKFICKHRLNENYLIRNLNEIEIEWNT